MERRTERASVKRYFENWIEKFRSLEWLPWRDGVVVSRSKDSGEVVTSMSEDFIDVVSLARVKPKC